MLFNSVEFAIFFPVVTILFFLLPHRYRWFLLLAASCFFYMFFKPVYIFILFFTIIIDYFAGIWIGKQENVRNRRLLLLASIIANVGVLAVFKYFNFVAENINAAFSSFRVDRQIPLLNILLPIGLSFHTFQAMSYTIEVYKKRQKPEHHFGIYALYVMFYPQLVAGPIERPQNILHQFYEKKHFSYENMRHGLILIAWGLVKKVVIADRLALFVNTVYSDTSAYRGLPLAVATIFFAFQILCDFSGYSDIAIGTARCMGYELMNNFDRPYEAKSIGEFWRKWHISLSTWFRDYVYIPLGGNQVSAGRRYLNLMIVFLISGVWHGANWTFVAWGALHGSFLVAEDILFKKFPALKTANGRVAATLKVLIVFALVTLAWVFFRAENVSSAVYVVKNIFIGWGSQLRGIVGNHNMERLNLLYLGQSGFQFYLSISLILILLAVDKSRGNIRFDQWLVSKRRPTRWAVYYCMIIVFVLLGIFNHSDFIYFQF